jgi:hypothetical protein
VTEAGEALRPLVLGLAEWGARWAFGEPRPDELDSTLLMWWIRGGIDPSAFGRPRVVIQVHFPDGKHRYYWLVIAADDVSLCVTDPGYDVDILIETPLGCCTRSGSAASNSTPPCATACCR